MLFLHPLPFCLGFLCDQIIGDPPKWPHPVIFMGKFIAWYEKKFNWGSPRRRRFWGAVLTILTVGGGFLLTYGIIWIGKFLSPIVGLVIEVLLLSTTLAGKSLLDAGKAVLAPLQRGDLEEGRTKLSWFVSRDTSQMGEEEITRGTIETLAENYVDGILSPLIYMALGGAPLAMAFKGVSTLDSMIAYRNERYEDFGWFAARLDDVANYIPARISVILLLVAGWLHRKPVVHAYKIWRRDAKGHPSPNGGNPESVMAGLLGIQLGGNNIYHGQVQYRAVMGDSLHKQTWRDIMGCQKVIRTGTWLAFGLLVIFLYFSI